MYSSMDQAVAGVNVVTFADVYLCTAANFGYRFLPRCFETRAFTENNEHFGLRKGYVPLAQQGLSIIV